MKRFARYSTLRMISLQKKKRKLERKTNGHLSEMDINLSLLATYNFRNIDTMIGFGICFVSSSNIIGLSEKEYLLCF